MDELETVLLKVWREACRHIEIDQSTENIAALLLKWLPIDHVWIRRLDRGRSGVETVAVGLPPNNAPLPNVFSQAAPDGLEAFSAWSARGKVEKGTRHSLGDGKLEFLIPAGVEGEILAGPLGKADEPLGVLLLTAAVRCTFEDRHLTLVQKLLEPFRSRWRTINICARSPRFAKPRKPTDVLS